MNCEARQTISFFHVWMLLRFPVDTAAKYKNRVPLFEVSSSLTGVQLGSLEENVLCAWGRQYKHATQPCPQYLDTVLWQGTECKVKPSTTPPTSLYSNVPRDQYMAHIYRVDLWIREWKETKKFTVPWALQASLFY